MGMILNIQQLSQEINLAVKTIRSTLVRNPGALPPRLVIPGQKRLLWLRTDVVKFYESQVRVHGSNPDFAAAKVAPPPPKPEEKKRGRPTKAEQVAARSKE